MGGSRTVVPKKPTRESPAQRSRRLQRSAKRAKEDGRWKKLSGFLKKYHQVAHK